LRLPERQRLLFGWHTVWISGVFEVAISPYDKRRAVAGHGEDAALKVAIGYVSGAKRANPHDFALPCPVEYDCD